MHTINFTHSLSIDCYHMIVEVKPKFPNILGGNKKLKNFITMNNIFTPLATY